MGTDYGFKVDGWGTSWSGPDHMAQGRRVGRINKLKALLDALKLGNLELAQNALNELLAFDVTLKSDSYLIKIGDALSKKLLYVAQKTAAAMQLDSHHFSYVPNVKSSENIANPANSSTRLSVAGSLGGQANVDLTPKKATSGEFGRIIDVTA
jgi:hypothetical protein